MYTWFFVTTLQEQEYDFAILYKTKQRSRHHRNARKQDAVIIEYCHI